MSGFDIFRKINAKLDEGWKLTNANCPICNTTILGQPASKDLYCVKCEMPVKFEPEEEEDEVEVINSGSGNGSASKKNEVEEFDNMLFSKDYEAKRKRADELSRKTGELLLKGWAMLEDTCMDCLFPYMKSKAGEVICVGCGPVNKKKEEAPKKPAVTETITSSPEVIKAQGVSKEETKQNKPVVAAKEEKIVEAPVREEAPRQKRERHARPYRSHEKCSTEENISAEVIEKFRFDESIDLYSKMTRILSQNLDAIEGQGLPSDLNKLREILEFQKQIDEAKMKVLLLNTKSKKQH